MLIGWMLIRLSNTQVITGFTPVVGKTIGGNVILAPGSQIVQPNKKGVMVKTPISGIVHLGTGSTLTQT